MVGAQHIDVLRSLGLLSRPSPSRRHVSLPLSWKAFVKHRRGREIAMLLTLLGAGSMGAVLALRYASGGPMTITFPWSADGEKHASSDNKKNRVGEDLKVPGLQNMGNNCFLNVVLQALASSEILVSFMEECAKVTDTQEVQAERAMMPLALAVADLLKELAEVHNTHKILSPRQVMLALGLYAQQFDLSMQQDAAEALAHLAAGLQEERDEYLNLHRPVSQSFGSVLGKESPPPQLHRSWLHWPLEGTLGSLMACQQCGFQFSTQFQYFNDIPLPPLQQGDGTIIDNCTLEDCLDQFTAPEWVANVKCSHCAHLEASQVLRTQLDICKMTTGQDQSLTVAIEGKIRVLEKCSCDDDCACENLILEQGGMWKSIFTNASKRLRIGSSPEVLCLQVQRAAMNEVGELRKLMGHVTFPMVLDLYPYTVAAQEGKVGTSHTRSEVQRDPSTQILRQCGAVLSNIRKFQGSGYPASLFSPHLDMKRGSDLGKQGIDDVKTMAVETAKDTEVKVEDPGSVPSEGLVHEGLIAVPLTADVISKVSTDQIEEIGILGDTEMIDPQFPLGGGSTPQKESTSFTSAGRTDLGALADPHSKTTPSTWLSTPDRLWDIEQSRISTSLTSRKLLYELLSVVVHHGGPQSGHYTVYRKVMLSQSASQTPEVDSPSTMSREFEKEIGAKDQVAETDLAGAANSVPVVVDRSIELGSDGTVPAEEALLVTEAGKNKKREEMPPMKENAKAVWFKVSDSYVTRVEESEVLLANASLFFYERSRSRN